MLRLRPRLLAHGCIPQTKGSKHIVSKNVGSIVVCRQNPKICSRDINIFKKITSRDTFDEDYDSLTLTIS